MSARHKLNQAHLLGTLVIASGVGVLTQSWIVFLIAGAVLLCGSVYTGDIRLDHHRRN
jgi:hypothetical protein